MGPDGTRMHKGAETELEMVRRHVRDGVGHLARQRRIVAGLHADSLLTEIAEQLLATFEDVQRQHMAHLALLEG